MQLSQQESKIKAGTNKVENTMPVSGWEVSLEEEGNGRTCYDKHGTATQIGNLV